MTQLYSNNASTRVAVGIDNVDTLLVVDTGFGQLFPQPVAAEDFFIITLEDTNGVLEICKCTSRATDNLVIVRGEQGTTPVAFPSQSRVECRLTAGDMAQFIQKDAPLLEADLDLGGNSVINGEIVGVPIRGATGDASNELVVPAAGAAPTIGGVEILVAGSVFIPVGIITMWSGSIVSIPAGWLLCDGTSGTPDLSGRFITAYEAGGEFGAIGPGGPTPGNRAVTESGGNAAGNTGDVSLSRDQMPNHKHGITPTAIVVQVGGREGNNNGAGPGTIAVDGVTGHTQADGVALPHSHTVPATTHTHQQNLEAYYVLAYIIKT